MVHTPSIHSSKTLDDFTPKRNANEDATTVTIREAETLGQSPDAEPERVRRRGCGEAHAPSMEDGPRGSRYHSEKHAFSPT